MKIQIIFWKLTLKKFFNTIVFRSGHQEKVLETQTWKIFLRFPLNIC